MSAPSFDWLNQAMTHHGLLVGLLVTFLGGLALNLTPCVYPMIPVTLAFFSGQAAGTMKRTALLAFVYVMGMSLCYALLGLLAAKTGALLGSWLQQPAVLIGIALIMVALSLSMFGLYELRPPQFLTRRLGQASAGLWGAFGMGVVVGLVAAPCIGPFMLGLLLFIGQMANATAGFFLLFAMGLGMGLPYLFLGLAAHRVGHLPKSGRWLVWVKRALGLVLLGMAFYFIRPVLPEAVLPRAAAVSSVAWVPYSQAAFDTAQQSHQPILIDIYADWCLPCVELDHVTFRHPDVVAALKSVTTLRVDATGELSAQAEALLGRYQVYGVPTVLLFDRNGVERKDLRLLGFLDPKAFLKRLAQIQR